jgi:hypothetical protein
MYGTIAELRLKSATAEDIARLAREYESLDIPGMLASYTLKSDSDPNVCYIVAVFQDEPSYRANAQSSAQHERYLRMRELLAEDPVWHDGHYVHSMAG